MSNTNKKNKVNATVLMERDDWEALNLIARQLGYSRTQFLTQIATGGIKIEKNRIAVEEEKLLGEC